MGPSAEVSVSNSPGGQGAFAGQLCALTHGTARCLGVPQRRLGALLLVSTALLDLRLEKSPWRVSSTVHGSRLQPCLGSSPHGCVSAAAQVDSWQFALLFSPLKKLLCEQGTQRCFACLDSVYLVKKKKKKPNSLQSCSCRGFLATPCGLQPEGTGAVG